MKNGLKIWSACAGGSPTPVSLIEISRSPFLLGRDWIVSSPAGLTSFMASMPLSIRFINTCCSCTRSPMTLERSSARSVRIEMEYRLASLRSRMIMSRTTSFTSTDSRCRESFLNSKRIRLIMSAARVTSLTTLDAASLASSMSGSSR